MSCDGSNAEASLFTSQRGLCWQCSEALHGCRVISYMYPVTLQPRYIHALLEFRMVVTESVIAQLYEEYFHHEAD